MTDAVRRRDVRYVDDFLVMDKRAVAPVPDWIASSWPREMQAVWRIQEASGIERAHLRFRCKSSQRQNPSVSVIFRDQPIWRIDLAPQSETKPNPHWGHRIGVPATVCGAHEHAWPDNRDYVLTSDVWGLPCRRPLPPRIRRLSQAIPWLAEKLQLELCPGWHEFDVPPQTDLFPG